MKTILEILKKEYINKTINVVKCICRNNNLNLVYLTKEYIDLYFDFYNHSFDLTDLGLLTIIDVECSLTNEGVYFSSYFHAVFENDIKVEFIPM